MQAVAELEQLVEFFADQQYGTTGVAQGQNFASNLRRCADVDTPGRLRHDEQLGIGVNLTPNNVLLQIAARERACHCGRTGSLDMEAFDDASGMTFQLLDANPATGKARMRDGFAARQQEVAREPEHRHGAASEPLLGDKMESDPTPRIRSQTRGVKVADLNRSGARANILSRQGVEQFLLPVAGNARNAQHLAGPNFERDVMEIDAKLVFARQRQRTNTQHRCTKPGLASRQLGRLGANHQTRQGSIGLLRRLANPGHPAAAQHGADVAQLTDFMQLVADVQNTAACVGNFFQHHKQLLHRLRHQHRSRLIENQKLRLGQQGADDFNPLHLTNAQCVHRPRRFNIETVLRRLGTDALHHLGQTHAPIQTEPDVLGHRDGAKQAEVLKHHGYAERTRLLRIADLHRPPVEQDAAGIGLDRTIDDLHQRRFAGAVFAQNRMDLARHDAHGHRVIGTHARIALADISKLKARGRHAVDDFKSGVKPGNLCQSHAKLMPTKLFRNIAILPEPGRRWPGGCPAPQLIDLSRIQDTNFRHREALSRTSLRA